MQFPRLFASKKNPDAENKPKTYASSHGRTYNFFGDRNRDDKRIKRYENIYEQGGIVSEAIDVYALYILSSGYRLEGDDTLVEQVNDRFNAMSFEMMLSKLIVNALVAGDGMAEVIHGKYDGKLKRIIPRRTSTMHVRFDDKGTPIGYEQVIAESTRRDVVKLQPDDIVRLTLIPSDTYGMSLIGRAYDEIIRDATTAESIKDAIRRHGNPKYHVRVGVGMDDPTLINRETIDAISDVFSNIDAKSEFTTSAAVEIKNIDTGGIPHVSEYNDLALQRLCAALGVPGEILGLRQGTTDATAVSRMEAFYDKISYYQRIVANVVNMQIIDKITPSPGQVKIIFNDIDGSDEADDATWMSNIMKATPADPTSILPAEYIQDRLNVPKDIRPKDDGSIDSIDE